MKRTRGIPTLFAGTVFRSRLEARWAWLFTALAWEWEYEPFDLDGYIPDFLILGPTPLLVEVKPFVSYQECFSLMQHLPRHETTETLIVGCVPILRQTDFHRSVAGVLREQPPEFDDLHPEDFTGAALWAACRSCGQAAVYHEEQSWRCRPCGHYDGDHYIGEVDLERLSSIWAQARNETQWTAA